MLRLKMSSLITKKLVFCPNITYDCRVSRTKYISNMTVYKVYIVYSVGRSVVYFLLFQNNHFGSSGV